MCDRTEDRDFNWVFKKRQLLLGDNDSYSRVKQLNIWIVFGEEFLNIVDVRLAPDLTVPKGMGISHNLL